MSDHLASIGQPIIGAWYIASLCVFHPCVTSSYTACTRLPSYIAVIGGCYPRRIRKLCTSILPLTALSKKRVVSFGYHPETEGYINSARQSQLKVLDLGVCPGQESIGIRVSSTLGSWAV